MWPTRTSTGYNCEVANPACRKRRLLGTHQWQSVLLVMELPVTHDWFEMDCHLSPSVISIRFTAWTWIAVRVVPSSRERGGVITTTTTTTENRYCLIAAIYYFSSALSSQRMSGNSIFGHSMHWRSWSNYCCNFGMMLPSIAILMSASLSP